MPIRISILIRIWIEYEVDSGTEYELEYELENDSKYEFQHEFEYGWAAIELSCIVGELSWIRTEYEPEIKLIGIEFNWIDLDSELELNWHFIWLDFDTSVDSDMNLNITWNINSNH